MTETKRYKCCIFAFRGFWLGSFAFLQFASQLAFASLLRGLASMGFRIAARPLFRARARRSFRFQASALATLANALATKTAALEAFVDGGFL